MYLKGEYSMLEIFMFFFLFNSDGFPRSRQIPTYDVPVASQQGLEDKPVLYGPTPMCGGSKKDGDRWCY